MVEINVKLNGIPIRGNRTLETIEIEALFGLKAEATLGIDTWVFTNNKYGNNSDLIRQFHDELPTEGATLTIEVTDGTETINFDFICDYNRYNITAENETEVGVVYQGAADSLLSVGGADITMRLLEVKGFLLTSDYVNHPYVVENRKTILEKLQLTAQVFTAFKVLGDEVFKVINITADLTSGGAIQAFVNLGQTLANLVLISVKLVQDLKQAHQLLFPPIRYHSAITLKTFIIKACAYIDYEVEFGTWDFDPVLIPSKNDEIGEKDPITTETQSGILRPGDFGYNLEEAIELAVKLMNGDKMIVGRTLHLRPKSDPFWLSGSGYIMPSVLVEQSVLTQNGTKRFNREEVFAARITSYIKDDSDYWTIQAQAQDGNGDRIAVRTVSPIDTVDKSRVNLNGIIDNEIPYSLVVRKDIVNDLIDFFNQFGNAYDLIKNRVEAIYSEYEEILEETLDPLEDVPVFTFNRDGALKVENDFFDKPKISLLERDELTRERIPENFNDIIGAKAIEENWYNWDSFVSGVRNPDNPNDTNGKEIYEGVRIRFNLTDFATILSKGFFTTQNGERGKFISITWNLRDDYAVCDFYVQKSWLGNIEENIS